MAAVIVPRNDEIFKIRGAGVAAGRDLQAGIAPCADDGERQAERGDMQNANVALPSIWRSGMGSSGFST